MPIDYQNQTPSFDFDLARREKSFWEPRPGRETFFFFALHDAARLLQRRRVRQPELADLQRIVILAYESAAMARRAADGNYDALAPHVDNFIVNSVRALNRSRRRAAKAAGARRPTRQG